MHKTTYARDIPWIFFTVVSGRCAILDFLGGFCLFLAISLLSFLRPSFHLYHFLGTILPSSCHQQAHTQHNITTSSGNNQQSLCHELTVVDRIERK